MPSFPILIEVYVCRKCRENIGCRWGDLDTICEKCPPSVQAQCDMPAEADKWSWTVCDDCAREEARR